MESFNVVGVTGRQGRVQVVDTLKCLLGFLQKQKINVLLDQSISDLLPNHSLPVCTRNELGQKCDLAIVVGGDGSMLSAARVLACYGIPVIGINRGRLGFLTDISPEDLEDRLTDVLEGRYFEENRFLLEIRVQRQGKVIGQGDALNDVVLHPGRSTRIVEFELHIDGLFVYKQRADGLIIATPTGSTAYALSGGGPIMHPGLDAIVLVPMYPHLLTNRPLVVGGGSKLKLVIQDENTISTQVSCDGQIHINTAQGDEISIEKKKNHLKLLHPSKHDFYDSCRSKLRWNSQYDRC